MRRSIPWRSYCQYRIGTNARLKSRYRQSSSDRGSQPAPVPVSYTHLDVYKRQVVGQRGADAMRAADRGQQPGAAPAIATLACTPGSEAVQLACVIIPVSYTHLDVYKRQPQL